MFSGLTWLRRCSSAAPCRRWLKLFPSATFSFLTQSHLASKIENNLHNFSPERWESTRLLQVYWFFKSMAKLASVSSNIIEVGCPKTKINVSALLAMIFFKKFYVSVRRLSKIICRERSSHFSLTVAHRSFSARLFSICVRFESTEAIVSQFIAMQNAFRTWCGRREVRDEIGWENKTCELAYAQFIDCDYGRLIDKQRIRRR